MDYSLISLQSKYLCPVLQQVVMRKQSYSQKKINLKKAASRQWLLRQMTDKYVKLARIDNWRCRSAYKLLEINEKYSILRPGLGVMDCGAAPGSWSEVASKFVNSLGPKNDPQTGFVISIDRDFFHPVDGCICVRNADFTLESTRIEIRKLLESRKIDVLLSDMAPNASGHKEMDHERIINLCMSVLDFSKTVLKEDGCLLCKLWEGGRTRHVISSLEMVFDDVRIVKPEASRSNSAEIFILARGYKNPKLM